MRVKMGPTRRDAVWGRTGLAFLLGLLCLAHPLSALHTEAGASASLQEPRLQTPPSLAPSHQNQRQQHRQQQQQQQRVEQEAQGKAGGVFEYREDFPLTNGSPQKTSTPTQANTPPTTATTATTQSASILLQVQKRLRGPWLALLSALPLSRATASSSPLNSDSQTVSTPLTPSLVFDYTDDFPQELPKDLLDGSELASSASDSLSDPGANSPALIAAARRRLNGAWEELLSEGLFSPQGVPRETPEDAPLDAEGDALPLGEGEGEREGGGRGESGREGRVQRAQSLLRLAAAAAHEAGIEGEFPLAFDYSEDFTSGEGEGEDALIAQVVARSSQGGRSQSQGQGRETPQGVGQGQGLGLGFSFPVRGTAARRLLADVRSTEEGGSGPLVIDNAEGFPSAGAEGEGSSSSGSAESLDPNDLTVFDNAEGFPATASSSESHSTDGVPGVSGTRGRGSQASTTSSSASPIQLQISDALSEALKPALDTVAAFVASGSEEVRRTLGGLKEALGVRLGWHDTLGQLYIEEGEGEGEHPGSADWEDELGERPGSEYTEDDEAEPDLGTLLDPSRQHAPEDEDDYFNTLPLPLRHKSQVTRRHSGRGVARSAAMGIILRQVLSMGDSDTVTVFENAGEGFPEEESPTAADSDRLTDSGAASVFENAGEGFPEEWQSEGEAQGEAEEGKDGRSSDYVPTEEQGDMPTEVFLQVSSSQMADNFPVEGTQDGLSSKHREARLKAQKAVQADDSNEFLGLPEVHSSELADSFPVEGTQDGVSNKHMEGRVRAQQALKAKAHDSQAQGTPKVESDVFDNFAEDFPDSLGEGGDGEGKGVRREEGKGVRKGSWGSTFRAGKVSPDVFDNAEDFPGELPKARTGSKRVPATRVPGFLSAHHEAAM